MRRCAGPVALVLLTMAVAVAPQGLAAVSGTQDDAGSGGDAPGQWLDALRLPLGAYRGELRAAPTPGVPTPMLDQEDWFAFAVPAGALLVLEAQVDAGADPVTFELATPTGRMAAWAVSGSGEPPRRVHAVADDAGWWHVRAFAFGSAGGAYGFEVSVIPLSEPRVARAGPGHVALSATLEEGGALEAQLSQWQSARPTPLRGDVLVFRDDGSLVLGASRTGGLAGDADVEALGQRWSLDARTHGWAWEGYLHTLRLAGPGTYHVVLMAAADDVYQSIHGVNVTRGALHGLTQGGIHALRPADFEAAASASTDLLDASLLAAREVEVAHRLVGTFACGEEDVSSCRVTGPDGAARPLAHARFLGEAPGLWRFARDAAVAESEPFPLFVADVRLLAPA